METKHTWKFFRAGGFDQVKLETGADMLNLEKLDQKLWAALACPTTGLHFDKRTLTLIDIDKDGRIRVPELLAAIKWTGSMLKNPDDMARKTSPLPLSAINDSTPEGKQVLSSARQILTHLGKKDATAISVEDTVDTVKILSQTAFNGDGIIVEDSASDDATKAVIRDIIACLGSEADRSGKPGISQAKVDQFFADAQAYSEWHAKGETNGIKPLNGSTDSAITTFRAVKAKIDDYFARCELAAFDTRAVNALNREEKEYLAIAAKDLTLTSAELAGLPLAQVAPKKALQLKEGVNPAWSNLISRFSSEIVSPILKKDTLTWEDWNQLNTQLAPYESWSNSKVGASVEKLQIKRVREILGSNAKATLAALIAKDKAEEANVSSISAVEKLTRFTRDLHLLCVNFASFKDFYDRGEPAIFQAGTLYLDQRSCDLTLPVEDAGRHATMAGLAGAFLAYCDCVRKGTGEKMSIVAIFSQGDDENLMVGRNGIFYDRQGRDWDATITKLIANPISLRQAFWLPYKKFVRMIEEQVAKRASAAEAASTAKLQAAAEVAAQADKKVPAIAGTPPAAAPAKKVDVGTVAALGVAFGAIGTLLTAVAAGFVKVTAYGPLAILGTIIALILLISGPSLILAYLKLRKRNLGPIMDANGWAVNAKAKISVPFGACLTKIPKLPAGSQRDMFDPYAEKKSPWPWVIALLILIGTAVYYYPTFNEKGWIYKATGGQFGKQKVEKTEKPPGTVTINVPANTTTTTTTTPEAPK